VEGRKRDRREKRGKGKGERGTEERRGGRGREEEEG
jgi:hypothetical protein